MKLNAITVTGAIVLGLLSTGQAAEINQQGASEIERNLTKLLPKALSSDGFVTVNPAGNRYEIIYDLAKLLKNINPADFAISGVVPWSIFATPQDDGLWKVEGNNSVNASGHFSAAGQPRTDFTYTVDSLIFSGLFDPAISYLRSGDFSSKAVRFSSKTDAEEVSVATDSSNYKLTSSESASAGRTNFAGSGTFSAFVETVTGRNVPPIEIRADTVDFAAAVNGVPAREIRDLVIFILDHADDKKLRRADSEALKSLLRKAFPLMTSLNETISLNNLTVSNVAGNGGAKTLDYTVAMSGPTNATRFDLGMAAEQISFDSSLVPAAYSSFVPSSVQVQLALPDIDLAAFGDELLKVDFSKPSSDRESEKAFEKLVEGHDFVVAFPKIAAVSSVYDADISGEIRGDPKMKKEYSMKATILARDFDKTIAAVQELAKTSPDLNQISFGLMMAKGFAKADPDGRQRWDIDIARSGAVTINGQVVKGAE
jgi:hypothetical protein